jgi:GT2 family glycosyltransferase
VRRAELCKSLPTAQAGSSRLSVSVVICTYLREESLRNVLLDLMAQDVLPDEVIVVDQTPEHEPTTDALLLALRPLVHRERQIEPNLPKARNRATELARSDTVLFVDDDVRLLPSFLSDLYTLFRTATVDAICPLVTAAGRPPGADVEIRYGFRGAWMARPLIAVDSAIGACMAIRRSAIIAVGGFDEDLGRLHPSASGEDLEFTRRLTRAGFVLALAPAVRVGHEADRPGGCRVREVADTCASRRAMAYITLKEGNAFDRLTPAAAARLVRVYFCRRDVLFSPLRLSKAWRALRTDVRVVRKFATSSVRYGAEYKSARRTSN